jgi:hypothetical protein
LQVTNLFPKILQDAPDLLESIDLTPVPSHFQVRTANALHILNVSTEELNPHPGILIQRSSTWPGRALITRSSRLRLIGVQSATDIAEGSQVLGRVHERAPESVAGRRGAQ